MNPAQFLAHRRRLTADPEYKKSIYGFDKLVHGSVWGAIAGAGYAVYRQKPVLPSLMIGATLGGAAMYIFNK